MSRGSCLLDDAAIKATKEETEMVIDSRAEDLFATADLTPSEVGYLDEGAPRAIGASLVALAQMGLLEFRSQRMVVDAKAAPAILEDPVQKSVFDFVSRSKRPNSIEDIRLNAEAATEAIRERLCQLGLLLDKRALWSWRVGIIMGPFLGVLVLFVLNGAKPFVSLQAGALVAIVTCVIFESRNGRTPRGDSTRRRLREEHAALKATAEHAPALLNPTELARAVAIYGPEILENGPLSLVGQSLKREKGSCGACGGCGGCGGCGCA
jgi:uncharacterized protein (TIGR04222 family)